MSESNFILKSKERVREIIFCLEKMKPKIFSTPIKNIFHQNNEKKTKTIMIYYLYIIDAYLNQSC